MPYSVFETAFGPAGTAWTDEGLTAFQLPGPDAAATEHALIERGAGPRVSPPPATVQAAIARVQQHLAGEFQDFTDLAYDWARVSSFQRSVYHAALTVKAGHTWSYGRLAAAIGQPPAVSRAIGTALGQNPWPLLVPCHRFIGADGHMTGFSGPGGIKTKLRLLALEGAELFAE